MQVFFLNFEGGGILKADCHKVLGTGADLNGKIQILTDKHSGVDRLTVLLVRIRFVAVADLGRSRTSGSVAGATLGADRRLQGD